MPGFRTIKRVFLMSAALVAALFLWSELSVFGWKRDVSSCRQQVTAACLTDLGVAAALNSRTLPAYLPGVTHLARMGRVPEAFEVEHRVLLKRGLTPEAATEGAHRRLASHRVTAALRRGENLDEAIQNTPSADRLALYISGLTLLGRNPYGLPKGRERGPDTETRATVAEIAERIARPVEGDTDAHRASNLVRAVELSGALGDREGAVRLLRQLPKRGDVAKILDVDLVRLIGPELVLELIPGTGTSRGSMLMVAAEAASKPQSAMAYLEQAFDIYAAEEPFPDYERMERVAVLAADLGHADQALRLARRIANAERQLFPAFKDIQAARALLAAGAPRDEVRLSIDRAHAAFPQDANEVIGFGLISGPIRWGPSGIGAQATRQLATLLARIGDLDGAIGLLTEAGDFRAFWGDMLRIDLPVGAVDRLLAAIRPGLTESEFAHMQAGIAERFSYSETSPAQQDWALTTARSILLSDASDDDLAFYTYRRIAGTGRRLEDPGIETEARKRMAHAALSSDNITWLISAGFAWYFYEERTAG